MSRKSGRVGSLMMTAVLVTSGLAACDSAPSGPQEPGAPAGTDTGDPAAPQPPPISGGTLLIAHDGRTAVAADPDRDQVYVVDLVSRAVATIALQPGDEPWRAVEDASGRVHVSLRRGGSLATIDLAKRAIVDRRSVCVAPRGVAYDAASDDVYVACASGELVELGAGGGPATRVAHLDRDLRDLVIQGDDVLVSRFRSAEVLHVSKATWTVASSASRPPDSADGATPSVAWRMIGLPGGRTVMMHQQAQDAVAVPTDPGGYGDGGDGCHRSVVEAALTTFSASWTTSSLPLSDAVLPVDVAVSPDEQRVAVIAAGNAKTNGLPDVLLFIGPNVILDPSGPPAPVGSCVFAHDTAVPQGQPTAAAFDGDGALVVQTRQPASLFLAGSGVTIPLSSLDRANAGHDTFHANSGAHIACASCHPEGGDDGRVWTFDKEGQRRTPSLQGTIAGTAPYHWAGEMRDFGQLAQEVLTVRMNGPTLSSKELSALEDWVNAIPAPTAPPPADPAAAARGDALFHGDAGCSQCHGGPKLTNNATVDVGTGGPFQVPPLVGVGYRAPFLHAGCAATLADRFTCGGSQHGNTAGLDAEQIADLVAYMGTL